MVLLGRPSALLHVRGQKLSRKYQDKTFKNELCHLQRSDCIACIEPNSGPC